MPRAPTARTQTTNMAICEDDLTSCRQKVSNMKKQLSLSHRRRLYVLNQSRRYRKSADFTGARGLLRVNPVPVNPLEGVILLYSYIHLLCDEK